MVLTPTPIHSPTPLRSVIQLLHSFSFFTMGIVADFSPHSFFCHANKEFCTRTISDSAACTTLLLILWVDARKPWPHGAACDWLRSAQHGRTRRRGQGLASRAQSEPCTSTVGARKSRGYGIQRECPLSSLSMGALCLTQARLAQGAVPLPQGQWRQSPSAFFTTCHLNLYRAQNTGYMLLSETWIVFAWHLWEIAPGCVMEENNEMTTVLKMYFNCLSAHICLAETVTQQFCDK